MVPFSMPRERAKPGEKVEVTCPNCGHKTLLAVPGNICLHFYRDEGEGGCGRLIKGTGGRCVICSYGAKDCDTGC
jgi:hypothetical protein